MYLTIFCSQVNIIIKRVLWHWCLFWLLWCKMAHNLLVQRAWTFSSRVFLTRHIILNKRTVLFWYIIKFAIIVHSSHTSRHQYLFLAAVLFADSQLHACGVVGWRTCNKSVLVWFSCLWLYYLGLSDLGLSCFGRFFDAMSLPIISKRLFVCNTL